MPVLFINMKEQTSLEKEPYLSFMKRFEALEGNLDGECVKLYVGKGKSGTFSKGFYIDESYCKNPMITFEFARINSSNKEGEKETFIRMTYSYECDSRYDLEWQMDMIKALRRRIPYFYIPSVSHLEFSSPIEDDVRLQFDVLVPESEDVPQVCCSLINQVIAIFSFED